MPKPRQKEPAPTPVLSKLEIESKLKKLISAKGGALLSCYQKSSTKLKVRCKNGHDFEMLSGNLYKGKWCAECNGNKKSNIATLRDFIASKGGSLLSDDYKNANSKIRLACKKGHEWSTTPSVLRRGHWCPECHRDTSGVHLGEEICRWHFEQLFEEKFPTAWPEWLLNVRGNIMQLDGYCEKLGIAFEHHGDQHERISTHFNMSAADLKKRKADDIRKTKLCKKQGITLISVPYAFRIGLQNLENKIRELCKKQRVTVPARTLDLSKLTLPAIEDRNELLKKTIEAKGGALVSGRFVSREDKIVVRCHCGNEWPTTVIVIMRNHWCPKCAKNQKLNIEELDHFVREKHSGRCLSKSVSNAHQILVWQCKAGHVFKMNANNMRTGYWCRECRGLHKKRTIKDLKAHATAKQGACKSKIFNGINSKYDWQCGCGYEWRATAASVILGGSWCPKCGAEQRASKRRRKTA